ncbi:glycosyltransferase [Acuticoccus sp. I52.16.1]|uniref:glycosyltransferase n=1 Tax=Acuticoccus sp. I52.16.1 TaxID=2928472 RepID=UPI001FD19DD6|nr:hypothetical protein [Acuticoccus sp. I52.16.1]UOM34321.1 hypothetical protein MRB58_21245 [Acuticoccus sp. I52.16.1]
MARQKRILLVAEPLRLSNAARLATLGRALHEAGYTVVLAADPACRKIVGDLPFRLIPLRPAMAREERKARWRALLPLFDVAMLEAYVREDIRLMRTVAPDLVIGDMRPSLPVSARSLGVRFAVIVDATFSAACALPFELPQVPLLRELGRGPAQTLMDLLVPMGMFVHALPGNMTRLNHGIAGWHSDVRQSYTDADLVIYPNVPEIVPMNEIPPTHRFIGPVLWPSHPHAPLPTWWDGLPPDRRIVWVNLSSFDEHSAAAAVLDGLEGAGVTIVASTTPDNPVVAGRIGVFAADTIRSSEMQRRASLVVTNADTTIIQQSLAAGTPVFVVPEPEESVAYAHAIAALGAGDLLHGSDPSAEAVRGAVLRILAEPAYAQAAQGVATMMARYHSGAAMVDFVDAVFQVAAHEIAA